MELTPSHIDSLFDAFAKSNVLVIGDAMLDVYTEGTINRTSPEAPVPIVDVRHRFSKAGGAANVACNIKALGATPTLLTIVGDDKAGNSIIGILSQHGIGTSHVVKSAHRPTTTKERVVCNGRHVVRIDEETTADIDDTEFDTIIAHFDEIVNGTELKAIVLQDYDKGMLSPRLIRRITETARQLSIPIMVDPKKEHFNDYEGAFLFKPNAKELCAGTGSNDDISSIVEASQRLCASKGHSFVMTTLSERGSVIANGTDSCHFEAVPRNIVDVSGAGDTVISTAALCLAVGETAVSAAFIANIAGGMVCEEQGVVCIDRQRLISEAKHLSAKP